MFYAIQSVSSRSDLDQDSSVAVVCFYQYCFYIYLRRYTFLLSVLKLYMVIIRFKKWYNNLNFAELKTPDKTQTYIGLTSNKFKTRFTQHKLSLTNKDYRGTTALSREAWKLRDTNGNPTYTLTWRILKRTTPYSPATRSCQLCLWEKYFIISSGKDNINSRSELTSTCIHRDKFKLSDYGQTLLCSILISIE